MGLSEIPDHRPEVRQGTTGTIFDRIASIFPSDSLDVGLPIDVLK